MLQKQQTDPSEEYFSSSTIDNPPSEKKRGKKKQGPLFDEAENEEEVSELLSAEAPQKVTFSLKVDIKSDSGNTSITAGPAKMYPERVEEVLLKYIDGKYFQNRLKAALGRL